MQFTPENVARILAGEKTQTRRVVKATHMVTEGMFIAPAFGRLIPGVSVPAVQSDPSWRDLWCVGKTYAIQPGRGKPAVARFQLEQIRYCARAGEISEDDAHAEGFADAAAFCAQYAALNGADALDKPCWCLAFHLVGDEGEGGRDGSTTRRRTLQGI